MLTFAGAFAAFTYLRPFLETRSHVSVPQLSALLLALGLAGFVRHQPPAAQRLFAHAMSTVALAAAAL